MKEEISNRIKELRKKHGFSQRYVAENLFISQAAYSLIENSQNGIVADHIIKLSGLYDVTTDFLLKGDKNLIRMSLSNGFVPFIKASAHAGFLKDYHMENWEDPYEWFRIPGFNPSQNQKLFEVEGDSMAPTVLPGDILICQTQKKLEKILDGSLILLVTEEAIIVKRLKLQPDPDYLLLESDNEEEVENIKISKNEIREVMMVRGKITGLLVPHHEIASKGKIRALEEALELLKKEVFKLNKKIAAMSN
ncbi:LexA family transcriptional regulator [Zunongwangia sp. F363]|uniref:LexA family transcriptional regulator n=1 Tax=Autumnicola tepida TaxID=3075595 RepID=A0ABU3CEX4_9FLAO|nr:LexA family transcriptional regulator [Zunongwangia sp. F363]MDT0644901.1 LexA family transcriptional regulator [Zunongwangia sp. F363]